MRSNRFDQRRSFSDYGDEVESATLPRPEFPDLYENPEKVFPLLIPYLESEIVQNALRVYAPELLERSQRVLQAIHTYAVVLEDESEPEENMSAFALRKTQSSIMPWHYLPEVPEFSQLRKKKLEAEFTRREKKPRFTESESYKREEAQRKELAAEKKRVWTETVTNGLLGKEITQPSSIVEALNDIPDLMFEIYKVFEELDTELAKIQPVLEYVNRVGRFTRWLSTEGEGLYDVDSEAVPQSKDGFALWLARYREEHPKQRSGGYKNMATAESAVHDLSEEYDNLYPLLLESKKYFPVIEKYPSGFTEIRDTLWYLQAMVQDDLFSRYQHISPEIADIKQKVQAVLETIPAGLSEYERPVDRMLEWDKVIRFLQDWVPQSEVARKLLDIIQHIKNFEAEHREEIVAERIRMITEIQEIEAEKLRLEKKRAQLESSILVLFSEESLSEQAEKENSEE